MNVVPFDFYVTPDPALCELEIGTWEGIRFIYEPYQIPRRMRSKPNRLVFKQRLKAKRRVGSRRFRKNQK
jgi:hypothetical protein